MVLPLAVTALDVALVSSIAALTGAVVTPVVTWIVTAMRNRHDRWEKLYEDRRDAFATLLRSGYTSLHVIREFVRVLEEDDAENMQLPTASDVDERLAELAQISLFSSPKVRDEVSRFEDVRQAAFDALAETETDTPQHVQDAIATLQPHVTALQRAIRGLGLCLHDAVSE